MTKFTFALLLTAFASTSAMAQGPTESVGVVQSVNGLVTVSQGNTLGNVVEDEKILSGARVVTTSTGSTVIKLNNGCIISLAPNQAVTIDSRLECKALVAGIVGTGAVAAGAATVAGTSTATAASASTAAGIGGGGVMAAFSSVVAIAMVTSSNSGNSGLPPPASGR